LRLAHGRRASLSRRMLWKISRAGKEMPNTSLEPTADAVAVRSMADSSIELGVSLLRFTRLWLSLIR
jgi:hypothetical protein